MCLAIHLALCFDISANTMDRCPHTYIYTRAYLTHVCTHIYTHAYHTHVHAHVYADMRISDMSMHACLCTLKCSHTQVVSVTMQESATQLQQKLREEQAAKKQKDAKIARRAALFMMHVATHLTLRLLQNQGHFQFY